MAITLANKQKMTGNNPNLGLVNTDRMTERMRNGGNDRQPKPSIALLLQSGAIK